MIEARKVSQLAGNVLKTNKITEKIAQFSRHYYKNKIVIIEKHKKLTIIYVARY